MGNFITSATSVFIPLISDEVIVPYVFHPYRWGGIPWQPPNQFVQTIVSKLSSIILLSLVSTISGIMSTINECRQYDVWKSFKRSIWVIYGYIIGSIILVIAPFIKAPLLATMAFIPYADYLVSGIITAFPIMFMGALGNMVLRYQVCQ